MSDESKRRDPAETVTASSKTMGKLSMIEFPVVVPISVRWGDMDAYQHVNNAKYFQFFESARITYFQRVMKGMGDAGIPEGVGPILAATSCRFKAPVKYPDTLHVGARVTELEDDRFTMALAAYSEEQEKVVATGDAVVVAYDYAAGKKARLPATWVAAIEEIEGRELRASK